MQAIRPRRDTLHEGTPAEHGTGVAPALASQASNTWTGSSGETLRFAGGQHRVVTTFVGARPTLDHSVGWRRTSEKSTDRHWLIAASTSHG